MFQNINQGTIDSKIYEDSKSKSNKNNILKDILELKNIPIYILSFMLSMVGITGEFSPFCISLVGACVASDTVPILIVVVAGMLGSLIKFGISGVLIYILTTLVMIASMFILKPLENQEERNEKIKISKNIFFSTIIVQLIKVGMAGFTIYDLLLSISFAIITMVFYKIFVNSIMVIKDFLENKAFSIEEILGASLIVSIALGAFGDLSIYNLSIRNILSILIVLILGWKNGVLVGTTAGVTIGVTMGVINTTAPIMVAAYALSGMIAGILNRFGKIGVIVGFCLGNIVLIYVANGYTVELIHFKEILVASVGLLLFPKSIQINIKEFIGNYKFLPVSSDGALNKSRETAERLNNVSNTLHEMVEKYKDEKEKKNYNVMSTNKEIFISELLDNLSGYENNILYDDLSNPESIIVEKIFNVLIDKQELTRKELLNILLSCNSYIAKTDDIEASEYFEKNITQIIRVINMSYKISKSSFVWQKKIEQNKKNIGIQLEGVSKAISNIAENIEKNIKQESKYTDEKRKIVDLLRNKNIDVQEISIQKEERFLIEIYLEKIRDIDIQAIEYVLSTILQEKIVFFEEVSKGIKFDFISDDKYVMAIANAGNVKRDSSVSGDNMLNVRLKDGKYLVALSDGMGSGEDARKSSYKALKMLENLLMSGFDKKISLELINTSLINQNEEIFATLDIAIIDLYSGKIEFLKNGACPTYIKNKNKVQIIKSTSLPAGILNKTNMQTFDKDIENGDIMVMCTDGILDSNVEYKNKELWVKYLLEDLETTNTKKISDIILNEALDNNYGVAKDDMSIIVCKFLNK